jgi:HEAT repeat protein
MRIVFSLCLLALLMTGCGRKVPPPPKAMPVKVAFAPPSPEPAAPAVDPVKAARQQAAAWGEKLFDKDDAVREQATQALKSLGEPAFPFLLRGLGSNSSEARFAAMQALVASQYWDHGPDLAPLLMNLLDDPDPDVRRGAARNMPLFDRSISDAEIEKGPFAPQRIEALKKVAKSDRLFDIRQAAEESIRKIQDAIAGKPSQNPNASAGTVGPVGNGRSGEVAPKRDSR